MKKIVALILAMAMCLSLLAACGGGNDTPAGTKPSTGDTKPAEKPLAGTYDIKVWVAEEIKPLTETQIANFNKTNDQGITFNATVEAVGEGDAATSMTTDIEAGADLFCFAQDQTARLIQAGALQKLGTAAADFVTTNNDKGTIAAVTSGENVYAYPLTSDNGYFMYYDKSVIKESDIESLEALIAACEASGRNFSFELENSWYIVSYFFGAGCVSEWQTDSEGKFIDVNDNFNSEYGMIAAKGMQELLTSGIYVNSSATADFDTDVATIYPNANLEFFYGNGGTFNRIGTLYLHAEPGSYLYQLRDDGRLVEANAEYDEYDENFVIKTRTINKYVISDVELPLLNTPIVNGGSNSNSGSTPNNGTVDSVVTNPNTGVELG